MSKWYYWGRWRCVMLFTEPWAYFRDTSAFSELGLKNDIKGDLKVLSGHYYFLENDLDVLYSWMSEDVKRLHKIFSSCDARIKRSLEIGENKDVKLFINELIDHMAYSTLIEMMDFCFERYMRGVCKDKGLDFDEVAQQMNPHKRTLLMQYNYELENLDEEDIDDFVRKHEWVGTHGFIGEPLTKEKVLEQMKSVSHDKIKNVKKEYSPDIMELIDIGSKLTYYRSQSIEALNKFIYCYRSYLGEMERTSLSYKDIVNLTSGELIEFYETGELPEDFKDRGLDFGISYVDGELEIILGNELESEIKKLQESIEDKNFVEGQVAYAGKVTGHVKILESKDDVNKVEEGDIIVANETTPDFVFAMRKAAAFVTNHGGITSHAAITSREMQKPCIIGTKIATRVLKDGDLVEVDADKGIVKKVSD